MGSYWPAHEIATEIDLNSRIFDPKTKTVIIVGNAGV
jgi:hypothetical protein